MATNTYVALATVTAAGGSASQVVMTSIPSTYTDLMLVINAKTSFNSSADAMYLFFNGDANNAHYSITRLSGNGSSASSDRYSASYMGWLSDALGTTIIHIPNYANTTTYKTYLTDSKSNGTYGIAGATVGLWRGSTGSATEAINAIRVDDVSGNFAAGSTFTLYGIKAASVGAYATGGVIYQDATYFYHAFPSTGTFTPSQNLSADILVVAGGGGGGNNGGGGGGAGGLLYFASQSLTNGTGYTCTVGGGGAGSTGSGGTGAFGSNGGDSQFGALTLVKGGGGGAYSTGTGIGLTGGSGGGGSGSGTGGTATSGQGNAGGAGLSSLVSYVAGGGGGGAGTAGAVGSGSTAGLGGNGLSTYSSTLLVPTGLGILNSSDGLRYIAAGGGGAGDSRGPSAGGSGGIGGGGTAGGSNAVNGTNGTIYTGSGGGGGQYYAASSYSSGSGGSGIIIVRYAK
jgi:hypothetical protein